jgi:hypothetical protein
MKDKENKKIVIWGVIATVVIIVLWILTYFLLRNCDNRGSLGDMYGTINALFSGMALAGIIFTILLQRQELKLQREELEETRKEFIIQNSTLKFQRFENTFFNLLNLHHQIVEGIDYETQIEKQRGRIVGGFVPASQKGREYEIVIIKGRDVFKDKYEELLRAIKDKGGDFKNTYMDYYETVQTDFGHYFRNIYRIIKFINETDFISMDEVNENNVSEKLIEKKNFEIQYKYTSMLRAQLSDYELLWIFYNCQTTNGYWKFKPLVEKFAILKNMPKNKIHNDSLLDEYKKTAYGLDKID